ncbi:MAG: hypothetical protein KKH08_03285 [Candidatus Omnitrophica bacterium]|nr:hypothetical protein [Candidatus Omnitrophota bacterium]
MKNKHLLTIFLIAVFILSGAATANALRVPINNERISLLLKKEDNRPNMVPKEADKLIENYKKAQTDEEKLTALDAFWAFKRPNGTSIAFLDKLLETEKPSIAQKAFDALEQFKIYTEGLRAARLNINKKETFASQDTMHFDYYMHMARDNTKGKLKVISGFEKGVAEKEYVEIDPRMLDLLTREIENKFNTTPTIAIRAYRALLKCEENYNQKLTPKTRALGKLAYLHDEKENYTNRLYAAEELGKIGDCGDIKAFAKYMKREKDPDILNALKNSLRQIFEVNKETMRFMIHHKQFSRLAHLL